MKHFQYLIGGVLICFLLFSCKTKAKVTAYGGGFPGSIEKTAIYSPAGATEARVDTVSHALPNATPQFKFKKQISKFDFNRQIIHKILLPTADSSATKPKLPVEKNAQAGFWTAIASWVIPAIVRIALALANVQFTGILIALAVLTLVGMIIALVLGITSIKIFKKNPNSFRGYSKAVAAIVIPSVYFLLALIYALTLILIWLILVALF